MPYSRAFTARADKPCKAASNQQIPQIDTVSALFLPHIPCVGAAVSGWCTDGLFTRNTNMVTPFKVIFNIHVCQLCL